MRHARKIPNNKFGFSDNKVYEKKKTKHKAEQKFCSFSKKEQKFNVENFALNPEVLRYTLYVVQKQRSSTNFSIKKFQICETASFRKCCASVSNIITMYNMPFNIICGKR